MLCNDDGISGAQWHVIRVRMVVQSAAEKEKYDIFS